MNKPQSVNENNPEIANKYRSEFDKMFDDIYQGRYPYRFIYLAQDLGESQEWIDYQIRDAHRWISQQPGYAEKRGWK